MKALPMKFRLLLKRLTDRDEETKVDEFESKSYGSDSMWSDNKSNIHVDRDLENRLKDALNSNDTVAFKRLIKGGVDVNARYRFNSSLLHEAVQLGKVECVEILLQNKAVVNKQNDYGRTALHLACRRGQLNIAKLLIKYGADPDIGTSEGQTALNIAIWRGKGWDVLPLVETLVGAGASVDRRDNDGWLPIHWAAKLNYLPIVKYLLQKNSLLDAEAEKCSLRSPLIMAVTNSNHALAKVLLWHGADVNAVNNRNQNAAEIVLNDKDIDCKTKLDFLHKLYDCGISVNKDHLQRMKKVAEELANKNKEKHSLLDMENIDQSLACLCRAKVRSHMKICTGGRSIVDSLSKLPLPKILLNYVQLSDVLE